MDIDGFIDLVRALPGTEEAPHHERCSARVKGKIYATWPTDGRSVNLMLDATAVPSALGPGVRELWWGRQLCGVTVELGAAPDDAVRMLTEAAWARRANGRRR